MRAIIDDDLSKFAAAALPWLEREPVFNNALATLVGQRARGEVPAEPDCLLARIVDGADTAGIAIRTPPHELLVSPLSPGAARALAAELAGVELPGVRGPADAAEAFAAAWQATTGARVRIGMAQRMYRLDTVTPPTGVAGRLRAATPGDAAQAAWWVHGFHVDAHGPRAPEPADAALARDWIAAGTLWMWEVGGSSVSMAGHRPPVAGVARISHVYTPPAHRRHGYAAACVAALSQRLLDAGSHSCMLYADLANPTSNAVYQRIGFRPAADAAIWRFGP